MGGARATQVRLSFESLPTLLKSLTPARWTLLEQLKLHRFLPIDCAGCERRRLRFAKPPGLGLHHNLRRAQPISSTAAATAGRAGTGAYMSS